VLIQGLALNIVLLQRVGVFELEFLLKEFHFYEDLLGEHGFQSFQMAEFALQKQLVVGKDVLFFAYQIGINGKRDRALN
jgi:hypothetical protein